VLDISAGMQDKGNPLDGSALRLTTLMSTPPGLAVVGKSPGLGNANGLPVPSTPNPDEQQSFPHTPGPKALPTLTELLASSRRSRQRPRPPSRKKDREGDRPAEPGSPSKGKRKASVEDEGLDARPYLSSPASNSSDEHIPISPRSPLLPLEGVFTQQPEAFLPDFASTQVPGNYTGGTTTTTGTGGLVEGYGYSSQFDVDGQCDQVSELLERDVDFDGWLRDLPLKEEPR
jgi:neural Wiskott-Aldrich syndrome protein